MSEERRVRKLTQMDVPKAAQTLKEAFAEDALAKLLTCHIKDPEERGKLDMLMYEVYLRQYISKGICLGIGELEDKFETVAMWATPTSVDDGLDDFTTLMDAGYDKVWKLAGPEGRKKIFVGMEKLLTITSAKIFEKDPRFRDKEVYNLVYLGSVASARGKGNVRRLFDYMFENYIDIPGSNNVAYLESSSPNNIPIYNRFGFYFYQNIVLGDTLSPYAKEGEDFAVMNVMIRDSFGRNWATPQRSKQDDTSAVSTKPIC